MELGTGMKYANFPCEWSFIKMIKKSMCSQGSGCLKGG